MIGTRYFGEFIRKIIHPVIKELDLVLRQCKELKISGKEMEKWLESAISCWWTIEVFKTVAFIICFSIGARVVFLVLI